MVSTTEFMTTTYQKQPIGINPQPNQERLPHLHLNIKHDKKLMKPVYLQYGAHMGQRVTKEPIYHNHNIPQTCFIVTIAISFLTNLNNLTGKFIQTLSFLFRNFILPYSIPSD